MDRQQFSRRVYLGNVLVSPLPHGKRFAGNALNISGLEIFCRNFLEQGCQVELLLRAGVALQNKRLGHVTSVRVDVDGNVLKIDFNCPLSPEEKQTLYKELGVKISV